MTSAHLRTYLPPVGGKRSVFNARLLGASPHPTYAHLLLLHLPTLRRYVAGPSAVKHVSNKAFSPCMEHFVWAWRDTLIITWGTHAGVEEGTPTEKGGISNSCGRRRRGENGNAADTFESAQAETNETSEAQNGTPAIPPTKRRDTGITVPHPSPMASPLVYTDGRHNQAGLNEKREKNLRMSSPKDRGRTHTIRLPLTISMCMQRSVRSGAREKARCWWITKSTLLVDNKIHWTQR